jgi:excisionase family DNA binding protein
MARNGYSGHRAFCPFAEYRIASARNSTQYRNMATEWVSTKAAMRLLGVGSTTIKRWADGGQLPFMRTVGGHRRFRLVDLRRLSQVSGPADASNGEAVTWQRWLLNSDLSFVSGKLQELRRTRQDWFEAADALGEVTRTIGENWEQGDCSVIEEHIASRKLAQGLSAISAALPVPKGSRVCLVAALFGERHGLGALLSQVCLRSMGYEALFLGTDVDPVMLAVHVQESKPDLVALSASSWQTNVASLKYQADQLGADCRQSGTELVLGGEGDWPERPEYGHRCRSFVEFRDILGGF